MRTASDRGAVSGVVRHLPRMIVVVLFCSSVTLLCPAARAQTEPAKKLVWNPLEFAIVKFNDDAPKSWNIYHSDKKGLLLVRVWKRYLFVDVQEQEVYDVDPQKITVRGNSVEWSFSDLPDKPIDTPEWTERNVGPLERIRFRLGKNGHFLELQLPLGPGGRAPALAVLDDRRALARHPGRGIQPHPPRCRPDADASRPAQSGAPRPLPGQVDTEDRPWPG